METTVVLAPEEGRTRLLATTNDHEFLRATLPSLTGADLRAIPLLLEALAMWKQQRLCVVLVADEAAASCCGAAYEALVDVRKLYYDVGVAVRPRRSRARSTTTEKVSFRDLRRFGRFEG